jgi:hypothetical protein
MIILLTSSHPGNQIEKNKMDGTCSTFGEDKDLVGKTEGKTCA